MGPDIARVNSTINLLETKQFISAVKGRGGDGGRGCGVKQDQADETRTDEDEDERTRTNEANAAEQITKVKCYIVIQSFILS